MSDSLSRNAEDGLKDLLSLSSELEVTDETKESALSIYRRAIEDGASGRRISDIVAACLLLGARRNDDPIDVCGVIENCGSERKSVFREKRNIKRDLNLEEKPMGVTRYVDKYAENLEIGDTARERAKELIKVSGENGFSLSGKNPRGVAAAGLYLAGLVTDESKKITQTDVVDISGVTEVTVRSHYTEIAENSGVGDIAESVVQERSGG